MSQATARLGAEPHVPGRPGLTIPLALLVVWLTTGANFLGFKLAVETLPPLLMVAARLLLAGVILLPLALHFGGGRWPERAQLRGAALSGLLLLVAGQGLMVLGIRDLPAGVTAVLASSSPLWLALLGRTLFGQPLGGRALAGVGLGFAGLIVLALTARGAGGGGLDLPAAAMVLGGAAAWAAGSLLGHRVAMPENAFVSAALQMMVAAPVLATLGLGLGEWSDFDPSAVSARSILGFGYLVVVGSLVGYAAFVWLNGAASAATANTFNYVAPVMALALGALLLGEPVTWGKVAASALALGGVALMVAGGGERPAGAAAPCPGRGARPCTG